MTLELKPEDQEYVEAIWKAPLRTIAGELTKVCPECGETPETNSDSDHAMVLCFVAIACEGYYVVNPNLVGFSRPNWSDWKEDLMHDPDDDEPHDDSPTVGGPGFDDDGYGS